jgi:hypothetical protein
VHIQSSYTSIHHTQVPRCDLRQLHVVGGVFLQPVTRPVVADTAAVQLRHRHHQMSQKPHISTPSKNVMPGGMQLSKTSSQVSPQQQQPPVP